MKNITMFVQKEFISKESDLSITIPNCYAQIYGHGDCTVPIGTVHLPKSQIKMVISNIGNEIFEITIPKWLCDKIVKDSFDKSSFDKKSENYSNMVYMSQKMAQVSLC